MMVRKNRRNVIRAIAISAGLLGIWASAQAESLPVPPAPPKTSQSQAQSGSPSVQCDKPDKVFLDLSKQYNESVVWQGDATGLGTLFITESPDGSTWTMIAVKKDGSLACIVNAGQNGNNGREGTVV